MKSKKQLCKLVGMDIADGIDLVELTGVAYRVKRCFSWKKNNKIVDVVVTDDEGKLKANCHGLADLIEQKQLTDDDIVTIKVARPTALFLVWAMILTATFGLFGAENFQPIARAIDEQVMAVSEQMGIVEEVATLPFCKDIEDESLCYNDDDIVGSNSGEFDINGCLDIPESSICYDDSDVAIEIEVPNVSGGCLDLPDSQCYDDLSAGNGNGNYNIETGLLGLSNGSFDIDGEEGNVVSGVLATVLNVFKSIRSVANNYSDANIDMSGLAKMIVALGQ